MTAITPEPAVAAAVAADAWLRRFREILIGVLGGTVAAIGALAFYTSFEAIKQYANGSGGIAPEHDWAIPLLVDSFIVVATGADVWFATTGHRRRLWEIWWPKALLAGAAGVSFALNVAHATSDKWTARGVAAIPPAALVLGVELLMMVLRRATALRTERLAAAQAEAEAAALAVTLERSTPTGRNRPELPARTRNRAAGSARNHRGGPPRADQATTAQAEPHGHNPPDGAAGAEPSSRHAQAVAWVLAERAAGRTPNGTDVAHQFGISTGMGRRAIRDAKQAAEPAHQPQATEALRLVGDRSTPNTEAGSEPAPALPAAQAGEA